MVVFLLHFLAKVLVADAYKFAGEFRGHLLVFIHSWARRRGRGVDAARGESQLVEASSTRSTSPMSPGFTMITKCARATTARWNHEDA